jgi:cytochrome P450
MRAPLYSANPNELFEPATISNPQTLYARLRAETPMARVAETGVHLLATWDFIEEALARESDFSANLTGVLMRGPSGDPTIFPMPTFGEGGGAIATADEPDHAVHRGIIQRRFSNFVSMLEEPVRRWAWEAIREWLAGDAGDFVPVAEMVPARVVGDLLGLPQDDVLRFRTWAMIGGDFLAGNVDETRLGFTAGEALKMVEYLGSTWTVSAWTSGRTPTRRSRTHSPGQSRTAVSNAKPPLASPPRCSQQGANRRRP